MGDVMNLTLEERGALAQLLAEIFDEWRLQPEQAIVLLGLPEKTKQRELERYKRGNPLPDDPLVEERARHLVGIWESLHVLNPLNPRAGYLWLNNKSKYFTKRPPLQVMLEDGIPGLKQVWTNLDCTQGWD